MSLSEVRMVSLGVRELEGALAFYQQALGYQLEERARLSAEQLSLLRFAPGQCGEYAVIAADDSGLGRLRLIAADRPGAPLWNEDNRLSASGYYALNFRARELRELLPRLLAAGGKGHPEPSFWEVSEAVAVYDSITEDPDGNRLDIFSYVRGGELRGPLHTEVSVLQTVALATRDLPRCRAFYEALGFRTLFDRVLDFPELQTLLGTAEPVRIHNVNLMKDGSIVPGRVEMFAYLGVEHLPEERLAPRAHPPAIGILSMSFECQDLDAALQLLAAAGASPLLPTRLLEVPGFGAARIAVVAGPDGEAIEVLQRVAL